MIKFGGFPSKTFEYLEELSENNNREWFADNKSNYERYVLEPAMEFIAALEKPLSRVAPLLEVKAKRVGGSLMRIYKDTRFSKDKTPYKTNIGIQFRHTAGKDVHAPGLYLHIDPRECFLGAGMWRPGAAALQSIRASIAEHTTQWRKTIGGKRFRESFEVYDDRLKTAPRGYPKDHPLIEDLRLKSFLGMKRLERQDIESPELASEIPKLARAAAPLMEFLCESVGQPY